MSDRVEVAGVGLHPFGRFADTTVTERVVPMWNNSLTGPPAWANVQKAEAAFTKRTRYCAS